MWHGKQHSMVMERHIMSMEEIQIYTINHDLGFSCTATSQKTQWRKENIYITPSSPSTGQGDQHQIPSQP